MKLPPGIRQRGNSLMVDVTVHGVRKTDTIAGLDVAAAVKLREELRASVANVVGASTQATDGVWTLQQAYDRTCTEYWCPAEAKSWKKLRQNGQRAVDHFGAATNMVDLTTDRISQYAQYLQDKGNLTGATVNRLMAAVSKMIRVALDYDKVPRKPKIKRWAESEGRIRYLTDEEERSILATFDVWGMADVLDVVTVLVDTGLRPSELWAVAKRDVSLSEAVLHLWKTKNRKARSVPMTTRVRQIIARRFELVHGQTGRLFPYTIDWLEDKWQPMREKLGMQDDPHFTPYVLRHTCASRLVQRGVSPKVIQEWLGHKSPLTTERYMHLAPRNLKDAVKVLEEGCIVAAGEGTQASSQAIDPQTGRTPVLPVSLRSDTCEEANRMEGGLVSL